MKKLLIYAIIIGGAYYFGSPLIADFMKPPGAFDAQGNPAVYLFVANNCGQPCDQIEQHLRRKKVKYDKFDIANSEDARKKLKQYGGNNSLPYIVVGDGRTVGSNTKDLDSILADAYGLKMLPPGQRRVVKTHFTKAGDPRVVLYGAEWCGYCDKTKEYMDKKGISYTEYDVEKSDKAMLYFNTLEGQGYPLVYVGSRRIGGYNISALQNAVDELM